MNRQVIAFLSLFSLVLVLSIYYVMIPFNHSQGKENAIEVNQPIDDPSKIYFDSLTLERDQDHQNYILEQKSVVSSVDESNDKKEIALNNIKLEEKNMETEKLLETSIIGLGYSKCFVQVKNKDVNIIAYKENGTNYDASDIIFSVQSALDDNYLNPIIEFHC